MVEISDIFEKHGLEGTIFIILLFFITSMLRSEKFLKFIGKIYDWFIEKFMRKKVDNANKIKPISESNINNHDIFNYIDFWVSSKIPTMQFSNEYRTAVFRRYLTLYLNAYRVKISEFIDSKEYQDMDDAKIWRALLDLINQIVNTYEREMLDTGIPKIVIDKMKVKNNVTITLIIDLTEGICNSQFYDSDKNLLKVYSILNILLSMLENTISNSESVCNSINGQLKGSTFNDNGQVYKE